MIFCFVFFALPSPIYSIQNDPYMNTYPDNTNLIHMVQNGSQTPVIRTGLGPLFGSVYMTRNGFSMYAYLSVPYSEIPEKFSKPTPKRSWSAVFDASPMPRGCAAAEDIPGTTKSDDCHYLKILVPTNRNGLLPVMFWIPGGGFKVGSIRDYDINAHGEYYVSKGIILVQPNYRMGALGFWTSGTNDAPGNYAFWDVLEALKFVKKNIWQFGGDPNQITLIGQGAGGVVTSALTLSPLARGMFSKSIQLSGTIFSPLWNIRPEIYTQDNKEFATAAGCDDAQNTRWNTGLLKDVVDCMRKLTTEAALNADARLNKAWRPRINDGIYGILPHSLEQLAIQRLQLPVLQGTTRDETAWDLMIVNSNPGNLDAQGNRRVPDNLNQINSADGTENICRTEIKPDNFENVLPVQNLCITKYSEVPKAIEMKLQQNTNAGEPQIHRSNPVVSSNDSRQPGDPFFWLQQSVQSGSSLLYHAPAMLDMAYHLLTQNRNAYLYSYDYFRQEAGPWWQVTGAFHNSDLILLEDFLLDSGLWGNNFQFTDLHFEF